MSYSLYKVLFNYIGRIYKYSLWAPHILVFFLSISLLIVGNILINYGYMYSYTEIKKDIGNILAGISILLAFLVLIIQGINFPQLNKIFSNEILLKRLGKSYRIKTSIIIKNTIFSTILTTILMIITILTLLTIKLSISDNIVIFLMISITCYLIVNILFSIIFWSFSIGKTDDTIN
ncbi:MULTISPECIES: hypothetical protein [unclassified Neisseria]|jgi:hypothetical protein|nr:hypothetical protein HMPREF2954_00460 [Neisseria sp. HMSC067H09]